MTTNAKLTPEDLAVCVLILRRKYPAIDPAKLTATLDAAENQSDAEPIGSTLTSEDMCDRLHCTPPTLRRYEHLGLLSFRRLGRRKLYQSKDIAKLLAGG